MEARLRNHFGCGKAIDIMSVRILALGIQHANPVFSASYYIVLH